MSLTDFLFQGNPPPSTTTYGSTSASLPAWFEAYQQGLLGKSNVIAGEPYQSFVAPNQQAYDDLSKARFAPWSSDTTQSWNLGRDAAAAGASSITEGTDATRTALGQSAYDTAQPLIQRGLDSPTVTNATSGYLNAGTQKWPTQANEYMNPYVDWAGQRISDLSTRNLTEDVLPKISDNFVKSGMFGSSRQGEFTNRAVRDQQNELQGNLGALYTTQYNKAADQFGADQSRQLTAGSTAGTAANYDTSNIYSAANMSGNFMNADRGVTGTLGQDMGNLGLNQQKQGLTGAATYQGIGQQQEGKQQTLLDTMYNNFIEQRDYPKTQAGFMNNMIRGLQAPQSTSTSSTGPASTYTASPFAQILGATGSLGALSGLFKAGGGRIAFRRGGPVEGALYPRGRNRFYSNGYLCEAA